MNINIQPWSKSLVRFENLKPVAIPDDSVYEEYNRICEKYKYKTRHISNGEMHPHKPDTWSWRMSGRPTKWRMNLTARPVSHFWLHVFDCEDMFPGCPCFPLMDLNAETCTLTHDDTIMQVKEATWCRNNGRGQMIILVATPWGDEVWEMYRI